jgi:hypothetical protein
MSNIGKLFICGKCSSGFKLLAEGTTGICPKCKTKNSLPGYQKPVASVIGNKLVMS